MKILEKMYLWSRQTTLNFGSRPHLYHEDPKIEKQLNLKS